MLNKKIMSKTQLFLAHEPLSCGKGTKGKRAHVPAISAEGREGPC